MRAQKRPAQIKAVVFGAANHAAMGIALGLGLALALLTIPSLGVSDVLNSSNDPKTSWTVFIGTFAAMFGIGAALTGSVLILEDSI
jgi:hypothetical protein